MQKPISFALDILLDCTTIEQAHKIARKYIKKLEALEKGIPDMRQAGAVPRDMHGQPIQAPSTQRLLEQHGLAQVAPAPIAAPARLPAAEIDKETGRAMVTTGNGTKGPRKF